MRNGHLSVTISVMHWKLLLLILYCINALHKYYGSHFHEYFDFFLLLFKKYMPRMNAVLQHMLISVWADNHLKNTPKLTSSFFLNCEQ